MVSRIALEKNMNADSAFLGALGSFFLRGFLAPFSPASALGAFGALGFLALGVPLSSSLQTLRMERDALVGARCQALFDMHCCRLASGQHCNLLDLFEYIHAGTNRTNCAGSCRTCVQP